jgi:hypothetical protein
MTDEQEDERVEDMAMSPLVRRWFEVVREAVEDAVRAACRRRMIVVSALATGGGGAPSCLKSTPAADSRRYRTALDLRRYSRGNRSRERGSWITTDAATTPVASWWPWPLRGLRRPFGRSARHKQGRATSSRRKSRARTWSSDLPLVGPPVPAAATLGYRARSTIARDQRHGLRRLSPRRARRASATLRDPSSPVLFTKRPRSASISRGEERHRKVSKDHLPPYPQGFSFVLRTPPCRPRNRGGSQASARRALVVAAAVLLLLGNGDGTKSENARSPCDRLDDRRHSANQPVGFLGTLPAAHSAR